MNQKFHKSCKTLSIYALTQALETGNLLFLLVDYDEFSESNDNPEQQLLNELAQAFHDMLHEYSELTNNRKFILNYVSLINIENEKFKYNCIKKTLEFYDEFKDKKIFTVLEGLKINFNEKADLNLEVSKLISLANRLKTKIDMMIFKYELKYKPKNNSKESKSNLEEEAISLAMILKLSYSIDIRTTSVVKWVSMNNLAKKINNSTNN